MHEVNLDTSYTRNIERLFTFFMSFTVSVSAALESTPEFAPELLQNCSPKVWGHFPQVQRLVLEQKLLTL